MHTFMHVFLGGLFGFASLLFLHWYWPQKWPFKCDSKDEEQLEEKDDSGNEDSGMA